MGVSEKLGALLVRNGLVTADQVDAALKLQRERGGRLGEILLAMNALEEDALVQSIGKQLNIPIVPSDQLATIQIDPAVVGRITGKLAHHHRVLPLLLLDDGQSLAVATSEPLDNSALAELVEATKTKRILCYLGKASVLRSAIERFYGAPPVSESSADGRLATATIGRVAVTQSARKVASPDSAPPAARGVGSAPPPPRGAMSMVSRRILIAERDKGIADRVRSLLEANGNRVELARTPEQLIELVKGEPFDIITIAATFADNINALRHKLSEVYPDWDVRVVPSFAHAIRGEPIPYLAMAEFAFDTMENLLTLLAKDPALKTRAHRLARYSRLLAQKLALSRKVADEAYLAGLIEGFAPSLLQQKGQQEAATTRRVALNRLLVESCPFDVARVLEHLEENWDGTGTHGKRGPQIPMATRLVRVVDAFLKQQGILGSGPDPGLKRLRELSGTELDPRALEAFIHIVLNERWLDNLYGPTETRNQVVFVVDRDEVATSALDMRLMNEGYQTHVFEDGKTALDAAREALPALIISEIALPKLDGFSLCLELKKDPATAELPFLFLSNKTDPFNMNKALELGADDFVAKPINLEFLLAKVRRLTSSSKALPKAQATSGVTGRLEDMSLIDIVQILGVGLKTVRIHLEQGEDFADIHAVEGTVCYAKVSQGATGAEAFYHVALWPGDTTFQIFPGEETPERNISLGNDFLILEALRRLDEHVGAPA